MTRNVWFIARVLARTLATIPAMYARLARDMWRERKQEQV